MATSDAAAASVGVVAPKPKRIAGAVITGHGFQHMYADGFLVLLPAIYDAFGLSPVSAGVLSSVRQGAGGILTMGGGFLVDTFAGRRGLLLAGSLFFMGLAYLLVAVAPNYGLLLGALALASATGSFWHPVGLGLLSATFPSNRALVVSLHRSAGSAGETVTPLVVGLVLALITWREVLLAGFIVITVVSVVLYIFLRRVGLQEGASDTRSLGQQSKSLWHLVRTERALRPLLLVSGLRGMADRALIFFLPLFIAESLRLVDPGVSGAQIGWVVGYHLVVFSVLGIFVPPLLGALSDRIGRRPVMVATLVATALILALLTQVSRVDFGFTALIGALGMFRFAVANLTQAGALDLAEGRRLEGTMVGLLWGNNALFGALSPLLAGYVVTFFAGGGNDFAVIFTYAAVMNLLALGAAMFLPSLGGRKPQTAVSP